MSESEDRIEKYMNPQPSKSPAVAGILGIIPVAVIALIVVWFLGSKNPVTPAGYVGYLTQGAVLGKTKFVGLQTGPTSSGRTWLLDVINVSVTPYTYTEEFTGGDSVLSKDNLKIGFRVHLLWKVRPAGVQDFVEHYSTIYGGEAADSVVETAYKNFLREPLRTFARDEVQQLDGLSIKDSITPIGQRIFKRVLELTKDTPFDVTSVVVGNIQYPEQVANAVSLKLAATQDLERKEIEIQQAKKDKEKRIIEAEAIAKSTEVINQQLTALYVQHEAIEAQKAMVGSQNHTTIYIPVGPMGVPIVNTIDTTKVEAKK
jgi:regulator of protease activity HflC (stomatin/prohibitin superfamily)